MKVTVNDREIDIPEGVFYSDKHQYAKQDGDLVIVGVSDFAQAQLGEIITCGLADAEGVTVAAGELIDVSVEAQKAVADIFSPISGEVVEVNEALEDEPETINSDPYGAGWLFKIKPSNFDGDKANLMDAAAYAASLK